LIARLNGILLEKEVQKDHTRVVVDVGGVGYEVLMGLTAIQRLPSVSRDISLYICESVTSYDGARTLYGFLTMDERNIFLQLKEHVPGVGPKKALESLDRINKSLPDFRRAVVEKDVRLLVGVFGFSKKTAEKLIYSLREKMESFSVSGQEKWGAIQRTNSAEADALAGLLSLGYRESHAREVLLDVRELLEQDELTPERLLREALKRLSNTKYA